MRQRNFYTLVGIAIVTLLAIIFDVSGLGAYTLTLGQPIVVHQGLDLQGGARVLLQAVPAPGQKVTDSDMNATRRVVESRVNGGLGVAEPQIQTVNSNNKRYISVELPGLKKNLQSVENLLQRTGQLTFVAMIQPLPKGMSAKGLQVIAQGRDLDPNGLSVSTDQAGQPQVNVTMRDPGASAIQTYTASHFHGYMGIVIDNKIYDSPRIDGSFGGNFQISNVGSLDNANNLKTTLQYGALPVPLTIASVQAVDASLGPANVRASALAGLVGIVIVVLFMAVYYRLPGLLADAALLIYALVVFAIFKLLGVTLTLAGIAGFILSIGMAVDANILIFERMKEELRAGRSVASAVNAGFARAWPSIRDSNASTMITCAILYYFGSKFATSTIVGFATTLFIGVVISMTTAILVSRTFLRLVLTSARSSRRGLFGADSTSVQAANVPAAASNVANVRGA